MSVWKMTFKNPFVTKRTDLRFPWDMRNSAGILISVAEGPQHTPNVSQGLAVQGELPVNPSVSPGDVTAKWSQ